MRFLFSLFGAVGIVLIVIGTWIPAKAILAQALINDAWDESMASSRVVKPWPWIDTWPVARLTVPEHDVSLIALKGLSGQALAFGPGLEMADRSARVASPIVIAGHNDTHFGFLEDLTSGDVVQLELQAESFRFLVTGSAVVDANDGPIEASEQDLVLVTCYPFNLSATNGSLRYVVTAVRENVPM